VNAAAIRARVPEGAKRAKRRAVALAGWVADKTVLSGIARRALQPRGETPARSKPHYLMVRYAYYGKDASTGESSEAFLLDRTLAATGVCTCEQFFWDRDFHGFPKGDWALLDRCARARPDAILLSSYDPSYRGQARVETIRVLRKAWNVPIVMFWWDTCWSGFWASIRPILPLVDVHVVADNPCLTFLDPGEAAASRFVPLWSSFDPVLYTNPGRHRDLDVSFLGQVDSYRSERVRYLDHLRNSGTAVTLSLVDRAKQPPLPTYVETLQRSKIGLNFAHSVDAPQLKGRVFETMLCGAMLLESDNPQTASYFRPMTDYVPFTSPQDLEDKIRYYLAHEDERARIAAAGEERTRSLYNHRVFWTRVFDALAASRARPL
jgi:hypothetical protein